MEIPTVEPILQNRSRRNSKVGVIRALNDLGFGTWNELQLNESDKVLGKTLKDKINDALNSKLADIEAKREKCLARDKRIAKLPDGPEKRKLIYQKNQDENAKRRKKKDLINEEQDLHEAYQVLLKEIAYKERKREKEKRRQEREANGLTVPTNDDDDSGDESDGGIMIGAAVF